MTPGTYRKTSSVPGVREAPRACLGTPEHSPPPRRKPSPSPTQTSPTAASPRFLPGAQGDAGSLFWGQAREGGAMRLRRNPGQCLLPPRPQPPAQPLDLALGLESHVEVRGLGRGAVFPGQAARPRLPAPRLPCQDGLPATLTLSASAVPGGALRFFHQKSQEQNE